MKATWNEQLRREPAAAAAVAIFVLSAATILGAWYFQYVLKLPPCPLCLEERLPYHIVIPLSLLMAIAAFVRAPRALITVGLSRRCRMALLARPDRLLGTVDRSHREGAADQSVAVDPRGALRRSGVALSRHLARRLQRADLARAGGDRGVRIARAQAGRLAYDFMIFFGILAATALQPETLASLWCAARCSSRLVTSLT